MSTLWLTPLLNYNSCYPSSSNSYHGTLGVTILRLLGQEMVVAPRHTPTKNVNKLRIIVLFRVQGLSPLKHANLFILGGPKKLFWFSNTTVMLTKTYMGLALTMLHGCLSFGLFFIMYIHKLQWKCLHFILCMNLTF